MQKSPLRYEVGPLAKLVPGNALILREIARGLLPPLRSLTARPEFGTVVWERVFPLSLAVVGRSPDPYASFRRRCLQGWRHYVCKQKAPLRYEAGPLAKLIPGNALVLREIARGCFRRCKA